MDSWSWRPGSGEWIGTLRRHLAHWTPDHLPPHAVELLRGALEQAIAARSDWLYHPFVAPLIPCVSLKLPLDPIQLPAWLAFSAGTSFTFRLEAPAKVITVAGNVVTFSGQVSSGDLAAAIGKRSAAGTSLLPVIGARPGTGSRAREDEFGRGMERIAAQLPHVAEWMVDATKLAGIMLPASGESFASASWPEIPGFISLSPSGDVMQVLESVVHETAHLYFFRHEAGAPLVRPSKRRFASPLRPDPRPLRGVLLAMHACAYVSAAFAEAEAARLDHPARCSAQRRETLTLFDEARRVVDTARELLTARGAVFVARTAEVAARASLRVAA